MNNVILIGRLTRDPKLRFIPNSGKAVAKFAIAVTREYSKEKEADFFNIVVWGKPAESCANYLVKGRLVAINGSMRNNNYEDKNGTKHYTIEVVAQRVEFLEWGEKKQDTNGYESQQHPKENTNQSYQHNNQDNMSGFQAVEGNDDEPF